MPTAIELLGYAFPGLHLKSEVCAGCSDTIKAASSWWPVTFAIA